MSNKGQTPTHSPLRVRIKLVAMMRSMAGQMTGLERRHPQRIGGSASCSEPTLPAARYQSLWRVQVLDYDVCLLRIDPTMQETPVSSDEEEGTMLWMPPLGAGGGEAAIVTRSTPRGGGRC